MGSPRQLRWWEALRVALEGLGLAKQGFGMNPNWGDAQSLAQDGAGVSLRRAVGGWW